jgi:excisionase family DNA binding protein
MDVGATLSRLEKVESELLSLLQELRAVKADLKGFAKRSPTLEPFLDAEEVAKILGVDTAYIYHQARARKIPSVRIGKYRRFSPSQIKKWLDRISTI